MSKVIKSPIFIVCIIFSLVLGIFISNGVKQNDFFHTFTAAFASYPRRYTIIIFILSIDLLIFENINNYILIFRYQSIQKFLLKSTVLEIFISFLLFLCLSIPILLTKNIAIIGVPMILFIINGVMVVSVFLSLIRVVNIWIGNRTISTVILLAIYTVFDVLFDQLEYSHLTYIFNFKDIFVLPITSGHWYPFLWMCMLLFIFISIYLMQKAMEERDYILKNDTDNK